MLTGSILATGVRAPVLPTCTSIFLIIENPFSAENLCAIAHLGELETKPSLFCNFKLSVRIRWYW